MFDFNDVRKGKKYNNMPNNVQDFVIKNTVKEILDCADLSFDIFKSDLVAVYKPKDKDELKEILVKSCIYYYCSFNSKRRSNLNWLDVSGITDMSCLFYGLDPGYIDISKWDVSNVVNMEEMFGEIDILDVDLSKWDVSNVKNVKNMFDYCPYNSIPKWYFEKKKELGQ